jgi:hypothetical protein
MNTARAAVLLAVLGAGVLSAQRTWGGLRFGMSEAETIATLKGRLKRQTPSAEAKSDLYEPFERFKVTPSGRAMIPFRDSGA